MREGKLIITASSCFCYITKNCENCVCTTQNFDIKYYAIYQQLFLLSDLKFQILMPNFPFSLQYTHALHISGTQLKIYFSFHLKSFLTLFLKHVAL